MNATLRPLTSARARDFIHAIGKPDERSQDTEGKEAPGYALDFSKVGSVAESLFKGEVSVDVDRPDLGLAFRNRLDPGG